MTTPILEQIARQIAAQVGIPLDAAMVEAPFKLAELQRQAAQAAAAAAPPPPPPDPLAGYDKLLAREQIHWKALDDPQRAARRAERRAQIEAEMRPLVAQRDALNKRIAALEAEYRDSL